MRIASACAQCRATKRKCSILQGQAKCYQCERQKIQCTLQKSARSHTTNNIGTATNENRVHSKCAGFIAEHGEAKVNGMVELYLCLVHDRPHSLFHITTLWNDIRERSIPAALLLSLCAIGCRLSPDDHIRSLAPSLTTQAKAEAKLIHDNICLSTIQTYILIANIFAAELEPALETLHFGMAIRMAQIVGLHRADPWRGAVERETHTRVWQSLKVADNFCSPGLGVPRQLSAHKDDDHAPLPADEVWFQSLPLGLLADSSSPPTPGLWAYVVQLVEVLGSILDLNRRLSEGMEDATAELRVQDLAEKLSGWLQNLPSTVQENEENFQHHRARGTGGLFVALHLGYHHYSTLLFFRYLDPGLSSFRSKEYARSCRYHALSFSHLLRKSRQSPGSEAVYATVGHMAVVSSSVLLHILLFGESTELEQARSDLTSNFAALLELKRYWTCLEHTIGRLFAFQDACLRDQHANANTHRVDSWMIRFLIEYSLKLDERAIPMQSVMQRNAPDTPDSNASGFDARQWMANKELSTLWQSAET